jgi:predicted porin
VAGGSLLGLSVTAMAQSSVTLYGIVDTGIEYVSHASATGDSVVRMPAVTGEFPSRWGLHGVEDIGGGYDVVFQLESGFNMDSGGLGQGGRLFGRQAFVGVKSPYGTLAFGRQYTMTASSLLSLDSIAPGIYGIGTLDAYLTVPRVDNAVTYQVSKSGITFGASYSFGRDSTGTGNTPGEGTCAGSPGSSECHDWSAVLEYDAQNFGLVASYEQENGGAGSAAYFFDGVAPLPTPSSGDEDTHLIAGAYAKVGGLKIAGGWVHRRLSNDTPGVADVDSNLFFLGGTYFITPALVLDEEIYRIVNAQHDTRATLGTTRLTYYLSKQTAVYMDIAYVWNSSHAQFTVSGGGGGTTPAPGIGQFGAMVGLRHSF